MWKRINNFSRYEISDQGEIKSIKTGILMIPFSSKTGYERIRLINDDQKRVHKLVHVLVAEAFIPNPNNYSEVNHIDGKRNNNCVENLEWCTHSQNVLHSYKMGKIQNVTIEKEKRTRIMNTRIGKIYDGRWKVIRFENPKYILQNIYNNEEMTIKDVTLRKVENGETTISRVRLHHMRRQGKKTGFKW